MTRNIIVKIARSHGRDYATPEDVVEAFKKRHSIHTIRRDALECLGGLCGVEDKSLFAFVAWKGSR